VYVTSTRCDYSVVRVVQRVTSSPTAQLLADALNSRSPRANVGAVCRTVIEMLVRTAWHSCDAQWRAVMKLDHDVYIVAYVRTTSVFCSVFITRCGEAWQHGIEPRLLRTTAPGPRVNRGPVSPHSVRQNISYLGDLLVDIIVRRTAIFLKTTVEVERLFGRIDCIRRGLKRRSAADSLSSCYRRQIDIRHQRPVWLHHLGRPPAHRGIAKTRNSRWILSARLPKCGEPRRRRRRCAFPLRFKQSISSVTFTVTRQEQSWLRPATSASWSHHLTQWWSAQHCPQTNS